MTQLIYIKKYVSWKQILTWLPHIRLHLCLTADDLLELLTFAEEVELKCDI